MTCVLRLRGVRNAAVLRRHSMEAAVLTRAMAMKGRYFFPFLLLFGLYVVVAVIYSLGTYEWDVERWHLARRSRRWFFGQGDPGAAIPALVLIITFGAVAAAVGAAGTLYWLRARRSQRRDGSRRG